MTTSDDKWRATRMHAAGTDRHPGSQLPMNEIADTDVAPRWATRGRGRAVLGVVMIVRNEVANLPGLLRSLADVADEVVIADTGSTDGTIALCRQWGVRLLHVPWRNDFAFARNRSIDGATASYLLRMDADEALPEKTRSELVRLRDEVLPRATPCGYDFVVVNRTASGTVTRHRETRLFPNLPTVRFRGAIHEEIVSGLEAAGIGRVALDAEVHHFGYEDAALVAEKNQRNEALLRQSLSERPRDVHLLVHLAQTLAGRGEPGEAETVLSSAMEIAETDGGFGPMIRAELHVLRAMFRRANASAGAARRDLRQARALAPGWAVPDAMEAEVAIVEGDTASVMEAVERARKGEFRVGTFAISMQRLRSNVELFAGFMEQQRGDAAAAEKLFSAAIAIDPASIEASVALGQALVDRGAWADALAVLEPVGENEQAVSRFVDLASLIALARFGAGNPGGAVACLAPLLDVFAQHLGGRSDVHPLELAEVTLRSGYPHAARNMMVLAQMAA